jgi:hypothetical protein
MDISSIYLYFLLLLRALGLLLVLLYRNLLMLALLQVHLLHLLEHLRTERELMVVI